MGKPGCLQHSRCAETYFFLWCSGKNAIGVRVMGAEDQLSIGAHINCGNSHSEVRCHLLYSSPTILPQHLVNIKFPPYMGGNLDAFDSQGSRLLHGGRNLKVIENGEIESKFHVALANSSQSRRVADNSSGPKKGSVRAASRARLVSLHIAINA